MRAMSFWRPIYFLILIPLSPTVAADVEKQFPIKVNVILSDDSQIRGEIPSPSKPLEMNSPFLGKVAVPLSNVVAITFVPDHAGATIQLLNGDKIQGVLGLELVKMRTLLGPVNIPLSVIKELHFQIRDAAGGGVINPEDWDSLPFPQNSNWPGGRGEPLRFENGEVILQGAQDVRSKKLYSTPVTVECEVLLEDRTSAHGGFQLRFVAEGQPKDLDLTRLTYLSWNYFHNATDRLSLNLHPSFPQELQRIADLPIRPGQPY